MIVTWTWMWGLLYTPNDRDNAVDVGSAVPAQYDRDNHVDAGKVLQLSAQ